MKVKTLQDYYSADYSMGTEERKQYAVIPVEDLKTLLCALVFMKNWQSSRVAMARLKQKDVDAEVNKEQKELEPLVDFYVKYQIEEGEFSDAFNGRSDGSGSVSLNESLQERR